MSDYSEQITEHEFKPSKYNSGFLLILRMNELWKEANNNAKKGNYHMWNEILDRIWMELIGDVKKPEEGQKSYEEINKELVLKYARACNLTFSNAFQEKSINERTIMATKKMALMERESFLRRLQNEQGKGTAYQQEEDDWE